MSHPASNDESVWAERVTIAVNFAAEQIIALPVELRPRALAMLAASFDRELKPLTQGRWRGNAYSHGYSRQAKR